MATILPTVDVVGDEALTNSLINKTITELQDDAVKALTSRYSFAGCSALRKLVFGSVTGTVSQFVFNNLAALKTVDFHQNVTLDAYAISNCTGLEALILRSDTLCIAKATYSMSGTGISAGTGYIYVPAALVDTYKADSAWSTYANQIRAIEDYPEVCDPYSWEAVAKHIEAGTYKDVYKIGDCVPVDLGSEGLINMQIAAFDADTLADGSGTAAISWVAKELLKTGHRMNPANSSGAEGTGSNGGWEKCEMRTYLDATIKPLIPTEVQGMIVTVNKSQNAPNGSSNVLQTTADALWIPSASEVGGSASAEKNLPKYTDVYTSSATREKAKSGTSYAINWYTRSAGPNNIWFGFNPSGSSSTPNGTNTSYGVCLGFCTGKTPA